ncbi:MAG: ABC transporter permease [Pseudanabaenaceae cyanobacterium]
MSWSKPPHHKTINAPNDPHPPDGTKDQASSPPVRQGTSIGLANWNLANWGWTVTVSGVALLVSVPVLVVLSSVFTKSSDLWQHLTETVLGSYITNSLWLMVGVGFGVTVVGISTAWLVTVGRFRGSSWLEWLLLLPLAAPAYLLAYAYTEYLEYYGPVQTALRDWFGWTSADEYFFPPIRSMGGAIAMLVLTLYPYVYLLARVAFLEQSNRIVEASRSLGCGPWRSFFTVALPLARPAATAGLSLALMETLNDYGTVQLFGVDTFATGIYRTWASFGERDTAMQLASVLTLFTLGLIVLEQYSRRQARYYQMSHRNQALATYRLRGLRGLGALLWCSLPVGLGFGLPAYLLVQRTMQNWQTALESNFLQLSWHSFSLAAASAGVGVLLSLVIAYGKRLVNNRWMAGAVRIAAMGYGIPGSVIAVGIMAAVGQVDQWVGDWLSTSWQVESGLFLSGTVYALIFAYIVRFLAVSLSTIDTSLLKIKPNLDEAARSLGENTPGILYKVHTPLLWGGLLTAGMLLFVDVMKELPATLIMRPSDYETLAVRVFLYAADERLNEAAAPALAILAVGLLPVLFLSWQIARVRRR